MSAHGSCFDVRWCHHGVRFMSLLSSWCAYIICNPNPGLGRFSVPHCLINPKGLCVGDGV